MSTDRSGRMALPLGDRSRGEKVKTGSGQGVELMTELAKGIMRCLIDGLAPDDCVFPITPDKYRREWNASLNRIGMQQFGPPHGLRHAGAAHFVAGGGGLEVARRRGRWNTSSALQRYTKSFILIARRSIMSDTNLLDGEEFWRAPGVAMAEALEKSKVARRPLTTRLTCTLRGLQGDSLPLGSTSELRPEVARPRSGLKAQIRRRST